MFPSPHGMTGGQMTKYKIPRRSTIDITAPPRYMFLSLMRGVSPLCIFNLWLNRDAAGTGFLLRIDDPHIRV